MHMKEMHYLRTSIYTNYNVLCPPYDAFTKIIRLGPICRVKLQYHFSLTYFT